MSHGLLRHYFGSKLDIWNAVVDAAEAEYLTGLEPVLGGPGTADAVQDATALLRALARTTERQADLARLLLREGSQGGEQLTYILQHLSQASERLHRSHTVAARYAEWLTG